MSATRLHSIIAQIIRDEGPMPVDRYMTLCLGHPEHGYYMKHDPIGEGGDFITSPEISQIFGELIGVWCATAYQAMGSPADLNLIELGPGRGTLMTDLMRAAKVMPQFASAARIHLVETSPMLRKIQEVTLGTEASWHTGLDAVPAGPGIVIANEFFDAIPIRQFECRDGRWMERCIGLDAEGRLTLGLVEYRCSWGPARQGAIVERSPQREAIARAVGARLATCPGAALIIDYGHLKSAAGDTLQAVRNHQFCGILDHPGESDLTAHVDFQSLHDALSVGGAAVHNPMTQRQFLIAMGLEARAAVLAGNAPPDQREIIDAAVERLAGESQMGNLFKVIAATTPGLPVAYPFGSNDRSS